MNRSVRETTTERRAIVPAIAAAIFLASFLTSTGASFAFDIGSLLNNKPKEPDKFQIIHVSALVALMANLSSHVNIYDANGWSLRSQAGVIAGAHLLTSPEKYDVAATLPADKNAKLVFYCADPH